MRPEQATAARRRGGAREKVRGVRAKRQVRDHYPNLVSCVGWTPPTVSWFGVNFTMAPSTGHVLVPSSDLERMFCVV